CHIAIENLQGNISIPIAAFKDAGVSRASTSSLTGITFTDLALPMGFQDRLDHGRGIAITDWNGDGYPDLFLANPGSPTVLNDQSFIMWDNGPDVVGNYTFAYGQVLVTGELALPATDLDHYTDRDPDLL